MLGARRDGISLPGRSCAFHRKAQKDNWRISQEGGLETLAVRRIPMETQEGLFKTVCDRKETSPELKQS